MKKLIWVLAVMLIAQAIAQAQTQVLSRNAVGYVKITAERNKLVLGRSDFEALDGSGGIAVSNLFGVQVPPMTVIHLWDKAQAQYLTIQRSSRGTWPGVASSKVERGSAFWVMIPASASNASYDIFLMGEVPDRFTAPTTTVVGISGINMVGYPYPVARRFLDLSLATALPPLSVVSFWDVTNQTYESYQKGTRGTWPVTMSNVVVSPGVGFWVRNTGTVNWVEAKPYTWP